MPNTRQDAVPATLELPVVPAGTVFPVWRVPWHGQTPAQHRLHAGDALLEERGRLSIVLGEAATHPPTISELLDALELPLTLPRRRRRRRGSAPLSPVRLPLLLEVHLPPGAALDVEALRRGTVVRLDNLISPRGEVTQPSGMPLEAQTWIVGRPDSLNVRLLQIVLPHQPEPDTTLLVRPANPWIDPPAPRLAPRKEMQEVIELFWQEKEGDGEEGSAD